MYCTWEWNTSILARIFLNAVNLLLLSKSVKKFNAIKQNKYTFFYYHYMSKIFCIITLGSVQIWYHTFLGNSLPPSHTFFPFSFYSFFSRPPSPNVWYHNRTRCSATHIYVSLNPFAKNYLSMTKISHFKRAPKLTKNCHFQKQIFFFFNYLLSFWTHRTVNPSFNFRWV